MDESRLDRLQRDIANIDASMKALRIERDKKQDQVWEIEDLMISLHNERDHVGRQILALIHDDKTSTST